MAGNSYGTEFRITSFGESHGTAIGVVIDGCPAGITIDESFVNAEMAKRRPGQSKIVSQRKESDKVEILSGVYDGKSLGTPIALLISNNDVKSKDYDHLKEVFRPSHADFTYHSKYVHRDYRGGGRSSARETAARVAAGAIAKILLKQHKIEINAFVSAVHNIKLDKPLASLNFLNTWKNDVHCPDDETATAMKNLIENIRKEGDTVGGTISCIIQKVPVGLGEPVFDKLHAELGKAMLSINAVKGFEIGSGFSSINYKGSDHNDIFYNDKGEIKTRTNHSGGIQGGISNGMPVTFNVAFKPVATIMRDQETVDKQGKQAIVKGKGRHDPCVLPRAVVIVEAMAALVIADFILRKK